MLKLDNNQLSGKCDCVGQRCPVPPHPCDSPHGLCLLTPGPIPTEMGQLMQLATLAVNNNQLSGKCDCVEQKCLAPVANGDHTIPVECPNIPCIYP